MIYLDSAATSYQKPPQVSLAVQRAFREMSSPGRGGYRSAAAAERAAFACRTMAEEMFRVGGTERIIFTLNATHALNIAIKTLVPRGGRAVISSFEHNAVTRPLTAIGAEIAVARAPLFEPEQMLNAFRKALRAPTDAVICTHASNVFGYILPITEIAQLCRQKGVPLIVDASQTAGILPIDMQSLGAAFIAMPGHKGLYGPQGTGMLLCGDILPEPLIEGGTGSESLRQEMPDFLPDRLEPGTPNMPGIAGLAAGMRFVLETGLERIYRHETKLINLTREKILQIPKIQCFSTENGKNQLGVLSFTAENYDSPELASALADRGIAVRGGLHCAPFAHETAGTLPDGTVRVSVSAFNRSGDIAALAQTLEKLLHSDRKK